MNEKIRVLGIDISKSSISACLLLSKPAEPRQFYYNYDFKLFKADASGIKGVLELNPDVAILEPTGTNYSKLWVTVLAQNGVEVRLVGHKELRNYRAYHLALPDKDDNADALALACYGLDYSSPTRYVTTKDATTTRIRESILRLNHLNRIKNPILNRLRQDLAWQFPEVAHIKSKRGTKGQVPLMWGWLCGQRTSKKYDRLYLDSVGLGLTSTVRLHAERLCSISNEEFAIECDINKLLNDSKFLPYRKAFKSFGFGMRLEAMILSQIYPLQKFLGENGKPIVQFTKSQNSLKATKRKLSLRRFQKMLGLAPSKEYSGDRRLIKVSGGNDLTRIAMWQWVFTTIEPKQNRLNNEIGSKLGKKIDKEKAAGRPARLVRSRVAAQGVKLLFAELVKCVVYNNDLE
jgi:transposase